jgi:hypothetical protein
MLSSCQKELSCEGPACRGEYDDGRAAYTFVQANGVCMSAVVKGNYFKQASLGDSNNVLLKLSVVKKGAYRISTDTVNGFYFNSTGTFTDTGWVTVNLKGYGKPLSAGNYIFKSSKASGCNFIVIVDTVPFVEKYYYDVTIDGKRYQQTVGNGIIMRNRNDGIEQLTAINSYIGTDGLLAVNDSSTNNDGLFISKASIQRPNITLNGLASFFSPGPQVLAPFSNSGYSDGIRIAWTNIDAEPVFDAWKSTNFPGTQTGSSFIITSVETYADAQGKPIAKVKASFNCILYSERGGPKVLTNGRFYAEFAGFDRIKYN